jgi:hypothetical protein
VHYAVSLGDDRRVLVSHDGPEVHARGERLESAIPVFCERAGFLDGRFDVELHGRSVEQWDSS